MKAPGLDPINRRILVALGDPASIDAEAVARRAGVAPDVVRHRLARLREAGVLRGVRADLDAEKAGCPVEALVLASTSTRTTAQHLEDLARTPRVTRLFTLASRSSVAFTVVAADVEAVRRLVASASSEAKLCDVEYTVVVRTIVDDPAAGLLGRQRVDVADPPLAP